MFLHLPSRSIPEYISPHTCTCSLLLICAIYASYLHFLELLAPRPNLPLLLVHLVAPELAKLLITSISLHPTLKDSLLITSIVHDTCITKDQECPSVPPIQEQDITPSDISHHSTQRGFSAHPDSSDKENQPLNPSLILTLFTPTMPTRPFGIGRQSTPSNPVPPISVPPRPPTPMSLSTPEFKQLSPLTFLVILQTPYTGSRPWGPT